MVRLCSFSILLLLLASSAASAAVLHIADGDCDGLRQALAVSGPNAATTVVLSSRGNYGYCPLAVTANVTVDGAGASLQAALAPDVSAIAVAVGANLTLRNVNIVGTPNPIPPRITGCVGWFPPISCLQERPLIDNNGTLVLESSSVSEVQYDYGDLISNHGDLTIRNTSIANNTNHGSGYGALLAIGPAGSVISVEHATIAANVLGPLGVFHADTVPGKGPLRIANSILNADGGPVCNLSLDVVQVVSLGGNIVSDNTCALGEPADRIVVDSGLGAFGDYGGLSNTVVLNENSPAVRAGLAANCEAADARGTVRNVQQRGGCDAGAFELGGGRGLLSQGGMSGLFFDASADGHYVTVQRLDWGTALVVWNTFDKNGRAAWIYSIGTVDGNHVHAQGAQNLGGVLQPGGAPTGSHGMAWGNIDINLTDCFNATFRYDSPLPNFGSGQFPLNRLAFLGDLDCSN